MPILTCPVAFWPAGIAVLGLLLGGPIAAQETSAAESDSLSEAFLIDDGGRRYRIVDYPKGKEGINYVRLGGNRIQVRNGVQLEVVSETPMHFQVKIFDAPAKPEVLDSVPEPVASTSEPGDSPREVPAVEEVVLEIVDRIELESFDQGLPRQGQWRNGFDLADMDADGKMDIVFGPSRKSSALPNLFLGNGAGKWRRWAGRYPDLQFDYGDAAAADFNRDGHMDFALGVHLSGVIVLVSDGKGGYDPWSEGISYRPAGKRAHPDAFSSRAIEAADWNGDGWMDIVALGEGPKGIVRNPSKGGMLSSPGLRVFLNQGTGKWKVLSTQSAGADVFGDSLAVADLDGDGRLDVFAATRSVQQRRQLHFQLQNGDWRAQIADFVRPGAFVFAVQAADLDADGYQDLLVGYVVSGENSQWTGVDVAYGAADGSFHRRALFLERSRVGVYSLAVGNLDSDERLDIAIGTGDARILLLLGDAERSFVVERSPVIQQEEQGCVVYGLRLGDLDGEPGDELIAAFAGERSGLGKFHETTGCTGGGRLRVWRSKPKG